MSAAEVSFDGEPPEDFDFRCPRRGNRCQGLLLKSNSFTKAHDLPHDPKGENGGWPQWDWDGNRESPTMKPSINCGACGWHGYIRRGHCVDTNGRDEPA